MIAAHAFDDCVLARARSLASKVARLPTGSSSRHMPKATTTGMNIPRTLFASETIAIHAVLLRSQPAQSIAFP